VAAVKRTFDELTAIARGAVEAVSKVDAELVVIVVVSENGTRPGQRGRFAAESNVRRGSDVARVCRDVAKAMEAA